MTQMTQMIQSEGIIPLTSTPDITSTFNVANSDNINSKDGLKGMQDKEDVHVNNNLSSSKYITNIEDQPNDQDANGSLKKNSAPSDI